LQRAKTETVRRFYYAHHSRRADVIEERLQLIAAATALTTDAAIVEPAMLTVQMLVEQLRALAVAIRRYEARQAALFAAHEDAPIFTSFPRRRGDLRAALAGGVWLRPHPLRERTIHPAVQRHRA